MDKTLKRIFLLHVGFFVIGTVLFLLSFHTPLFSCSVFFYRGIALLTLISAILAVFLVRVRKGVPRGLWTVRDIIISVLLVWSVNLIFFTHVPVTADRSLSVFLLGYMDSHSTSVSKETIRQAFIDTYITDNRAVEKRLEEQITTGTIIKVGDGYRLTPRGRWVLRMYAWVADVFGIGNKNFK